MNILIILINVLDPMRGGVERVYSNLAPYLINQGHLTYAYYFVSSKNDQKHCYTDIHKACHLNNRKINRKELINVVNKWHIDCIICANPIASIMLAALDTSAKVFIHVHNVPSILMDGPMGIFRKYHIDNHFSRWVSHWRMKLKFSPVFHKVKKGNHKVVLLSEHFRNDFHTFSNLNDQYIVSMPNPFVIDSTYKLEEKSTREKELLFVGRISDKQKNITSLLHIWEKIMNRLPQWKLTIVGGGNELSYFQAMADDMKLERCHFEGFQNPIPYYKRASLLLMTSRYEGFGMVLVEAMQYGCIPFAYNSFAALPDVITDGIDGFVVPAFDEDAYVESICHFLSMDTKKQLNMRYSAISKAMTYNVCNIGDKWIELFKQSKL